MIGSKQIKPVTPLGGGVARGVGANEACFQQMGLPLLVGQYLADWYMFEDGSFTKCYGNCQSGTFTAEIYLGTEINPTFIITDAGTSGVSPEVGAVTSYTLGTIVRCKITASGTCEGLFILVT